MRGTEFQHGLEYGLIIGAPCGFASRNGRFEKDLVLVGGCKGRHCPFFKAKNALRATSRRSAGAQRSKHHYRRVIGNRCRWG